MSFFTDLVGSIGGDNRTVQPLGQISHKPSALTSANSNSASATVSRSAPSTPAASSDRPAYKGTAKTSTAPQQSGNLKRKAEDLATERAVKIPKRSPSLQKISDRGGQKPARSDSTDTQSPVSVKPTNGIAASHPPPQNASRPLARPPTKGSYADMIARAKEAQQSKAPSAVGMIKHQRVEKSKISRLAERKRAEQEKGKTSGSTQGGKAATVPKADARRRSASPVKSSKKGDLSTSKQPKAPLPPLHGPPRPQAPAYKGTIGQTPKRDREDTRRKARRYDEYLGTDEEDEGDEGMGGYGDEEEYYSDASSMMEGNFDDLEMEERQALRAAKEDDAKELELETKLKQEKLARKQRLAALAAKRR